MIANAHQQHKRRKQKFSGGPRSISLNNITILYYISNASHKNLGVAWPPAPCPPFPTPMNNEFKLQT